MLVVAELWQASRLRVLGLLAVGAVVALSAAGCGSSAKPKPVSELARGRELFQTASKSDVRCGFCHALKSSTATGTFSIDLDGEFTLDRAAGMTESALRDDVLKFLSDPPCPDPTSPNRCMPKDLLTGDDAEAVATFVARCAGRSGTPACRPVAAGPQGAAARGERLYSALGCPSCHWAAETKAIAPSFYGLAGSSVELADGRKVKATDSYLLESILAPDKELVRGYERGAMSVRVKPGVIPRAQARALVAYIRTLK